MKHLAKKGGEGWGAFVKIGMFKFRSKNIWQLFLENFLQPKFECRKKRHFGESEYFSYQLFQDYLSARDFKVVKGFFIIR